MGGTVEVESEIEVGSVFSVCLPLAECPLNHEITQRPDATSPRDMVSKDQRTLLYIEDNLSNLRLVERALLPCPELRLLTAMQGGLALSLASEHHPDLILLDAHLPDIGGAEVLSRLRSESDTQSIPVVVISADATEAQRKHFLSAGAQAYLTKPLDVREFIDTVRAVLSPRENG
jgi:CheY-like chemotaxis protein